MRSMLRLGSQSLFVEFARVIIGPSPNQSLKDEYALQGCFEIHPFSGNECLLSTLSNISNCKCHIKK